ncbi:transglycosylase SLT domain-containing protein [Flavobacteriales bacterium]|nr:transglycosylase SLT domain-containing protein [Flavobacteriales bacterium]
MGNWGWHILIGFLTAIITPVNGQADTTIVDTVEVIEKPDLSFVDNYDSMLVAHYREMNHFTLDTGELNVLNLPTDSIPRFSDAVFKLRIEQLDQQSPFSFVANDATFEMIKLYAYKRKRLTSKMLAYGELYFPIFEEYLIKYDMPLELKYLPIVESALNPKAKSSAGAGGLWQFMPKTGMMYDLSITSYVDKRFDPYLASDAACQYLKFLHSIYDDWSMALAAYNAGPGNVNKAIRRSDGKTTYWEIRPYLFKETRNYIPAFTAVNYIMNYASEHNLYPNKPLFLALEVDTIYICDRIEFEVLEEWLGYEISKLKYLNPKFISNVIPKPDSIDFIYLPNFLIGDFIMHEDSIYKYSSLENKYFVAANKPKKVLKTHYVKSGESLRAIAKKYNCTEQEIKAWNLLSSNYLKSGKKLSIYSEGSAIQNASSSANKTDLKQETFSGEYTYYTIRRGDTLWDIAQKYNGVSVDDLKRHNSSLNSNNLKTGTKIKVVKK